MALLPFHQVPQQAVTCSRMLAHALRVPAYQALGLAVALDVWAVEMAPEGDTSGALPLGDPAVQVALGVGWEGDPAALLAALLTSGFLVREGEVIRYPHLKKYESAMAAPSKRSEHARKAAVERWERARAVPKDAPPCPSMPGDAKREMERKTEKIETTPQPPKGGDGGGQVSSSSRAVDNPTPRRQGPHPDALPFEAGAPHGSEAAAWTLPDAVEAIHEHLTGRRYGFNPGRDGKPVDVLMGYCAEALLEPADWPGEVARRFGRALIRSTWRFERAAGKAVTLRELARPECWSINAEAPWEDKQVRNMTSGVLEPQRIVYDPWDQVRDTREAA